MFGSPNDLQSKGDYREGSNGGWVGAALVDPVDGSPYNVGKTFAFGSLALSRWTVTLGARQYLGNVDGAPQCYIGPR